MGNAGPAPSTAPCSAATLTLPCPAPVPIFCTLPPFNLCPAPLPRPAPLRSYVVPLVFFHFCRKWTTKRDDICTNDNRGIVALGEALLGWLLVGWLFGWWFGWSGAGSATLGVRSRRPAALSRTSVLQPPQGLAVLLRTCTITRCVPSHLPGGAGPALPVASVPSHSRGGSLVDGALSAAALNGSAYGGSEGSSKIGGLGGGSGAGAAPGGGGSGWQQRPSSAAVLGAGGSAHEVQLDIEMAGRASSAPVLDEAAAPPSPVKQAAQQAWSAISGLPRRMAGGAPAHRRTESQEPVLLQEDKSSTSVGS